MFPHRPYARIALIALLLAPAVHAADAQLEPALDSITAAELQDHVNTLADDVFEGRGVGSRGGRAAAQYIIQQLRASRLAPAGTEDGYFQPCDRGGRNILALLPGTDPKLQHEFVVLGAHYDHVGDGRKGHANGPIGMIYNGADDNASGVAALLETTEALSDASLGTRRSILFAFWDGEEMGMLGSKQWFKAPTVPTDAVRLAFNIDMVGRLRNGRLEVLGTRTGYGMRRLLCGSVDNSIWLDYSWELTANSDHWPFLDHQIPIAMLHTGLHDDYHRPSDDAEKINAAGLESVTRYLLATLVEAADADSLPAFRPARRYESLATQKRDRKRDASLVSLSEPSEPSESSEPGRQTLSEPIRAKLREPRPRPRLGISWRTDEAEPASVYLTQVMTGSPAAAAGLAADDRIYAVNGQPFADAAEFRTAVFRLLDAGVAEFTLLAESRGHVRTVTIRWPPQTLAAKAGI